ncbi:predicted protein [Histoplasma mississippiense (nom. inval.)]|uniref:predicted protein n=1 Tax=Ajellomyces capsulatus (strain NAm1 / WU24) TaxID=2059318 RepID=UPI000157BF51|nr:predicted protein [Histoplasma mississippiense (nom. inval.)]EDN06780.1 predicted protein [Histoplasma mississippiense (nom. inval.)]
MSPTKRLKNLGLAKEYAWVNVTSRNALGLLTRTTSWFPGAKYRIRSASGNFFIHTKAIEFGQEAPTGRINQCAFVETLCWPSIPYDILKAFKWKRASNIPEKQTVVNRQTAVDRPLRIATNYDITTGYIYRASGQKTFDKSRQCELVKDVATDLMSAFSLVLKNNIGSMGTKAK